MNSDDLIQRADARLAAAIERMEQLSGALDLPSVQPLKARVDTAVVHVHAARAALAEDHPDRSVLAEHFALAINMAANNVGVVVTNSKSTLRDRDAAMRIRSLLDGAAALVEAVAR